MDIETVKQYCASRKGATSDYPFDGETLVFRVMGKIFSLMSGASRVNLKCDPAMADILRQTYPAVTPGYHMNKRHWNTLELDGSVPDDEVLEMIDHSYEQVVKGLSKSQQERLSRL